MLLGVPLDYRRTEYIADDVSTFGRFHTWHQADQLLVHTLAYVHSLLPLASPMMWSIGSIMILVLLEFLGLLLFMFCQRTLLIFSLRMKITCLLMEIVGDNNIKYKPSIRGRVMFTRS